MSTSSTAMSLDDAGLALLAAGATGFFAGALAAGFAAAGFLAEGAAVAAAAFFAAGLAARAFADAGFLAAVLVAGATGFLAGALVAGFAGVLAAGLAILVFVFQHFLMTFLAFAHLVWRQGWRTGGYSAWGIYLGTTFLMGLTVLLLLRFPDGAGQYFSNLAAFAALSYLVVIAVQSWERRIIEDEGTRPFASRRMSWTITLPLVVFSGFWGGYGVLAPWPRTNDSHAVNPLVESLMRIRDQAPLNVAIRMAPGCLSDLPPTACWTRPFLLPAVSERPWVNVLSSQDGCLYQNYSYPAYGSDAISGVIEGAPVLSAEMKVLSPPFFDRR
jgi:hypothetical protein